MTTTTVVDVEGAELVVMGGGTEVAVVPMLESREVLLTLRDIWAMAGTAERRATLRNCMMRVEDY